MPGPVLSRKCPPAIYRRAAYMRPLLRGKTLRFHIHFFQQHFCGQKHHRQPARTRQQKRQYIPGQHVSAAVGVHALLHQAVGPQQGIALAADQHSRNAADQP